MIIAAARQAASDLFDRDFRGVLWKSLGLTIVLFFAMWIGLEFVISTFLTPILGPWPWLSTALVWVMGTGMVIGAGYLIAPVTALFAGFFLDDVAGGIEQKHYSDHKPGTPVPMGISAWLAIKFALVVLGANIIALLLVLLPGVNFAIFFLVNGYLLGREYFTFAAMRFLDENQSNELRRRHGTEVFLAGMVISGFMVVPILNLLTPIFAVSMMIHLFKQIQPEHPFDREPNRSALAA